MPNDRLLERYGRASEWPLTFAAVLFFVAYAWPILDPDLAEPLQVACTVTTRSVWVAFVFDYLLRLWYAEDRTRYVRSHLLDLAVLVLPALRPLRAVRALIALRILERRAGAFVRGRVVAYVSAAVAAVGFVAALAVLDAERGRDNANINTFGDALWWAATTITTVGYGDRFPTTGEGRLVGVALMACGIGLVGVATAALASWFVERVRESAGSMEDHLLTELAQVTKELGALRAELEDQRR